MNRVIFYCDKCGREVNHTALYSVWIRLLGGEHEAHNGCVVANDFNSPPDMELCETCRDEFIRRVEEFKKGGTRWK